MLRPGCVQGGQEANNGDLLLGVHYRRIHSSTAGVFDTAEQFFAGVVDTGDKHLFANISANFLKKFKTAPMEYLGAWGTLIHEKKTEIENLVSDSL